MHDPGWLIPEGIGWDSFVKGKGNNLFLHDLLGVQERSGLENAFVDRIATFRTSVSPRFFSRTSGAAHNDPAYHAHDFLIFAEVIVGSFHLQNEVEMKPFRKAEVEGLGGFRNPQLMVVIVRVIGAQRCYIRAPGNKADGLARLDK